MGRRLARELVFKYIFEADINKENFRENIDFYTEREESNELQKEQYSYIRETINGMKENMEEIDSVIKENMENWSLDRLGIVERSLLRYSVYELLYTNIGKEIIANEAIELAKKYGEEKSSEFLNGVLARIIKSF
jgi:N utilization substance protein B